MSRFGFAGWSDSVGAFFFFDENKAHIYRHENIRQIFAERHGSPPCTFRFKGNANFSYPPLFGDKNFPVPKKIRHLSIPKTLPLNFYTLLYIGMYVRVGSFALAPVCFQAIFPKKRAVPSEKKEVTGSLFFGGLPQIFRSIEF